MLGISARKDPAVISFAWRERRHAPETHLSNSGWIFSCFLRFEIVFWSATLKNDGATSVSHLGSIAVTSRMYSRLCAVLVSVCPRWRQEGNVRTL